MSETNEEDLLAQLAALGQADQFAADKVEEERQRALRTNVGVPPGLARPGPQKIRLTQIPSKILEGIGGAYMKGAQEVSRGLDDAFTQYGSGLPTQVDPNAVVRIPGMSVNLPGAPLPTILPPPRQRSAESQPQQEETKASEQKAKKSEVEEEKLAIQEAISPGSTSLSMSVSAPLRRSRVRSDMEAYEEAKREAESAYEKIEKYESEDRRLAKVAADEAEAALKEADDIRGRYKFDPYKAMPTLGSKIAAGIAIALGEAARGLRGGQGENIGLNMINQAIDREMKRQQSEYQKLGDKVQTANNLYARNLQILGNAEAAEAKTKAMMIQQAKVKVDSLLRQADQEQLNARYQAGLDANLAKANAQARVKTNSGIFGKPATLSFIKETVGDLKAATEVIGTITQAKSALRKMDLGAVREMAQALQDDGNSLLGRDSTLTKIKRLSVQKLNEMDEAGRQSFMKKLGDIVLSVSDESYAGAQEFGNIINLLAFGMAKQGQSSSSISNRDVQMFVNVLADAAKDPQLLFGYMDHLQQLADFDAKVSNFLTKPDQNGIIPQSRGVNHGQARAVVAERNPNVTILPNGTIETDFIRYLKNTNQLDLAAARGLGVEGI